MIIFLVMLFSFLKSHAHAKLINLNPREKKESTNFIDGNFERIADLVNLLLREWILTREFLAEMALANFNDFSEAFLCIATFLNATAQF